MQLEELTQRLKTVDTMVQQAKGQRDLLLSQLEQTERIIEETAHEAELSDKAGQLLRRLGANQRNVLQTIISPLCTDALKDIFGPDSEFQLHFRRTDSGRYRADILTNTSGFIGPPRDTGGGSVCEVLSVVLRIAFLMLHHPRLSPVLVLDEPLSNLDEDKVPVFGDFLADICQRLSNEGVNLQIIAAVHMLARSLSPFASKVWEVKMTGSGSVVKEADLVDDSWDRNSWEGM